MTKSILPILILLFATSCYYDSEEELYPTLACSTEDMSYAADIFPILEENCYRCHDAANNFGGVTLEGREELLRYVNNGELLGAIRHESGFSPMPKNAPMLLECEIEKIETWISAGAPDN